MIVKNRTEIPYSTCQNAAMHPGGRNMFEGELEVRGERLRVIVSNELEESPISLPHVQARVKVLRRARNGNIGSYAIEVAERQLRDERWMPVQVDLSDGETVYLRTWTHDYPADEDMDEFLGEARTFLEAHIDELRNLAGTAPEADVIPEGLEEHVRRAIEALAEHDEDPLPHGDDDTSIEDLLGLF